MSPPPLGGYYNPNSIDDTRVEPKYQAHADFAPSQILAPRPHNAPPRDVSGALLNSRGSKKVVPGLLRPLTFKRMNSEKRDELLEVQDKPGNRQGIIQPAQSKTTHSFRVSDDRYRYFVSVYINDTLVKALPDNCSELNLVSEAFVGHLKLDNPPETPIRLPNGMFIKASGSVTTHCRFTEYGETFQVKFVVLPRCLHHVILSDSFLQATETELVLGSRIHHERISSVSPIQVCLSGTPRQHVVGSINGEEVMASPDIGSDVNVITEDRAHALGLVIVPDPDSSELFFVDGSSIPTCGILRDIEWRFGKPSTTGRHAEFGEGRYVSPRAVVDWKFGTDMAQGDIFICDFYVVKRLTVSVILSSTLLYGTNAFTACPQHFKKYHKIKRNAALQIDHSDVAVLHRMSRLHAGTKDMCKSVGRRFTGSTNTTGISTSTSFH
jgi:hypothetical protein